MSDRMDPAARDNLIELANQHYHADRIPESEQLVRQILQQNRNDPQALNLSALIAHVTGRLPLAQEFVEQALKHSPDNPHFLNNLGMILFSRDQRDQSIATFKKALALQPSLAEAHNNLSTALRMQGDIGAAIVEVQTALNLNPNFPDAICNLGDCLMDEGLLDEAVTAYDRAISLRPNAAQFHMNLSFALLKAGKFPRGWAEYEWRLKRPDFGNRQFPHPRWDGQPLNGRRILLHPEQGFGDALQFIRYTDLVARRGGKILVQIQPPLFRLFKTIPSIDRLVRLGDPLPPFVVHCPIMSLPHILGTTLETIPAIVPYLKPDPLLVHHFQEKWPRVPGIKKIGLSWAGSPGNTNNRNRSIPASALSPLLQLPNIQFFSLQKGDTAHELTTLHQNSPTTPLIDCSPEIHDFADTAAIIADLDLVIAVDSSVAHLAGALGKPVWTLLTFNADFRYFLHRDDSPWYPTMRLFRQTKRADWTAPLERILQVLS